MKQGANQVDQNRMAKMFKAGDSCEKISQALLIDVEVVKRFKPKTVKVASETAEPEIADPVKAALESIKK